MTAFPARTGGFVTIASNRRPSTGRKYSPARASAFRRPLSSMFFRASATARWLTSVSTARPWGARAAAAEGQWGRAGREGEGLREKEGARVGSALREDPGVGEEAEGPPAD